MVELQNFFAPRKNARREVRRVMPMMRHPRDHDATSRTISSRRVCDIGELFNLSYLVSVKINVSYLLSVYNWMCNKMDFYIFILFFTY